MEYDKQKYVQWFCGFYEGEGWVSNDKSNNNRLRLGLAQNDITPLEIAQKIWGGRIRKRVRKSIASDKICTGYELIMSHKQSLIFIEDIKSFMLIPYKINQIKNVMERLKQGNPEKYQCKLCDKSYASQGGRHRHVLQAHNDNNSKRYQCTYCEKDYSTIDTRRRHILKSHSNSDVSNR